MPDFYSGATDRLGCFTEGFSLRRFQTERALAVTVARQTGLILLAVGTRDVDWWDGRTFHFRRPDTGIDHHAPAGGER